MNATTLPAAIRTYGSDLTIENAEPIVIHWAAELLADTIGEDKAARALRRANGTRVRLGLIPAYPRFGDRLFRRGGSC